MRVLSFKYLVSLFLVIPAKAGIHSEVEPAGSAWIPAFAGMTGKGLRKNDRNIPPSSLGLTAFRHRTPTLAR